MYTYLHTHNTAAHINTHFYDTDTYTVMYFLSLSLQPLPIVTLPMLSQTTFPVFKREFFLLYEYVQYMLYFVSAPFLLYSSDLKALIL